MKNLFGENWFSIADFCEKMGYDLRTKLQRKLSNDQLRLIFEHALLNMLLQILMAMK